MKRLGAFSGKIYTEEDFKSHNINECCRVISDEESKNEQFIKNTYTKIHENCSDCQGCPESMKRYDVSDNNLKESVIDDTKPPIITVELNYAEVVAILHACRRSISNDKLSLERIGLSKESRSIFETGIKCSESIIDKVTSSYLKQLQNKGEY